MKELDRERKELKEKKEELLKLEAMMKADKEVLVGEINERLSKLKDYMTTSEKDTAAMIANLTEKLSKVVKPRYVMFVISPELFDLQIYNCNVC